MFLYLELLGVQFYFNLYNMLVIFQILGLIIPVGIILGIYMHLCYICNVYPERKNESVPVWQVVIFAFSLFILGFTLGTIVMGGS